MASPAFSMQVCSVCAIVACTAPCILLRLRYASHYVVRHRMDKSMAADALVHVDASSMPLAVDLKKTACTTEPTTGGTHTCKKRGYSVWDIEYPCVWIQFIPSTDGCLIWCCEAGRPQSACHPRSPTEETACQEKAVLLMTT
jgi:hypothetical protein